MNYRKLPGAELADPMGPRKTDLMDEASEKLRVPAVYVKAEHWKVGDGMNGTSSDPEPFVIGQIALVSGKKYGDFEIRYFDVNGKYRGSQKVRLVKE